MSEKQSSKGLLNVFGTVVGAIGGWTLSQYCGSSIWIPGGAGVLLLLLFAKTSFKPRFFAGAIAATAGHLVWFLVGALIARNWAVTGADILVLAAGLVWLWLRPGLGSFLFLGIVQTLSLGVNLIAIFAAHFGSAEHRALTAHVALRLIALACLVAGYWQMKKKPSEPLAVSVAPPLEQESRQP